MDESGSELLRHELRGHLARLWRYGIVLSASRDAAEDLVQATCVRALERAHQFTPGTRLDRWLFSILHSIWMNELRARRIRQGHGFVDPDLLTLDDGRRAETNIWARQVFTEVQALPEAQRQAIFLVYVEGLSYRETADLLDVPIGTVMSRIAAARVVLGRFAGEGRAGDAEETRRQ
jgi:RNA polymerase sigma-70 factor (ECF subfamily)